MGTIFPMWGSSEQTHPLKPDMRVYLLILAVSPHTETPHPLTNIPRATACERAHQFCKNLGCVVPKQRTEDWVDGPLYHKLGRTLACSPEAATLLQTMKLEFYIHWKMIWHDVCRPLHIPTLHFDVCHIDFAFIFSQLHNFVSNKMATAGLYCLSAWLKTKER